MKFLQISDYVYVNVDRIDAIARDMHGDLNICVGGSEEPWCVSNLYVDNVLAWVNKNLEDTILEPQPCEDAISVSVIEDIKAEIKEYRDNFILAGRHDLAAAVETCLMFIDKHISKKESK